MALYSLDLTSDKGNIYMLMHMGLQFAAEQDMDIAMVMTDFINGSSSLAETIAVFEHHFGHIVRLDNKDKVTNDSARYDDELQSWQKEILEREGISITPKKKNTPSNDEYMDVRIFLN